MIICLDKRRKLVEIGGILSVRRQCELLGLNRSSFYYKPGIESEYNMLLMKEIDEQYTKLPFYGSRRMVLALHQSGHDVNRKRVQRLMRILGIQAIYPKPKLSEKHPEHRIYPYLLRGLPIIQPNQVWCADITYIRMLRGFFYLIAIMDWYSRYVLSWRLSNTLDTSFCLEALEDALSNYPAPEIFNSDQGSQFTSECFTERLLEQGIRISMDGRGRVFDNIFIERLWRTLKYEEVYLHDYVDGIEAVDRIGWYWRFYNNERPHQALGNKTPLEVYTNVSHISN